MISRSVRRILIPPEGRATGDVTLKRQYRIVNGQMRFMLDTSLNIHDDLLQKELSQTSSDQMRNIVATIQRDQNAIIRNEQAHTLIIQGAAGSGKTSIALHRIAFLLYRFKETISSDDVLIISPSKVFGHYIANVLPELGEESIQETTLEALAGHLLGQPLRFESFHEQVATILRAKNKKYEVRLRFKSTPAFLEQLEAFALYVKNNNVTAHDLEIGAHTIPAAFIEERLIGNHGKPFAQRITDATEDIVQRIYQRHATEIAGKERTRIRNTLKKMFWSTDVKKLYKHFYEWLGETEMFKPGKGGALECADVFPLIHLGILLEGAQADTRVKHLLVDEMQDYTPVQYKVLARIFPCKKTILGDCNQTVNPFSGSNAESIQHVLPHAECMYLDRSYRSTLEISRLAQRIRHNPDLIPIERHGVEPAYFACADDDEEVERIASLLSTFHAGDYETFGIICKTQDQVDDLYQALHARDATVQRLDAYSTSIQKGALIATAHLAKGLEFDSVLVPFCNQSNYKSDIDRQMLYVACTRAMHVLQFTHTHKRSRLLESPL
jgi:DNA helicase II / ATP-dependent DNA helicase PcrA